MSTPTYSMTAWCMDAIDYSVLFQKPRLPASSIIYHRRRLPVPVLESTFIYITCQDLMLRTLRGLWTITRDVFDTLCTFGQRTLNIGIWTLECHFGSRSPNIGTYLYLERLPFYRLSINLNNY